ncbi:MAG: tRNA uridine-5-carboxymethylaminomethyl(34) synthesis GTPase MnmE [Bacteroidia bacterium]
MNFNREDTIAALATAPGVAAIAMLRLSGKNAFDIINKIFVSKNNKKKDFHKVKSHTLHFGSLRDGDKEVDEVLISVFKNPHSYNGEDTIEISCHGSPYITQQVLNLCVKSGARLAYAGEFTFRAFINGKLDLSQAEAVADVIAADSESSHRVALQQLRGGFSNDIKKLRDELIHFASLIELELDFSEEDVVFANREQLKKLVSGLQITVSSLSDSFELGNVIKNGIPVVIAGKPNVGKSTLLNVLLNEERAIVSEIAGTTRDTIEEVININGVIFRFTDTAGIRETVDKIESLGVQRTYEKLGQSAVIIYMIDVDETSKLELEEILKDLKDNLSDAKTIILPVVNKIDNSDLKSMEKEFQSFDKITFISAKNKLNIDRLIKLLLEKVNLSKINFDSSIVVNARHKEALDNTNIALQKVLLGINAGITGDFLASDIREALYHLGLITGEISTDDLLENIFSRFCIGK